jgi:hypothetical protein
MRAVTVIVLGVTRTSYPHVRVCPASGAQGLRHGAQVTAGPPAPTWFAIGRVASTRAAVQGPCGHSSLLLSGHVRTQPRRHTPKRPRTEWPMCVQKRWRRHAAEDAPGQWTVAHRWLPCSWAPCSPARRRRRRRRRAGATALCATSAATCQRVSDICCGGAVAQCGHATAFPRNCFTSRRCRLLNVMGDYVPLARWLPKYSVSRFACAAHQTYVALIGRMAAGS